MSSSKLELTALAHVPMVQDGDDVAALLVAACARSGVVLQDRDVMVIAQKIISKAEGRRIKLDDVTVGSEARKLAEETEKDPRVVELILSEANRVVRARPGLIIVEHRLGFVMANAGIDLSNTGAADGGDYALLLPVDPDGSAEAIRAALAQTAGADVAVVINDSFGRPWRHGTVGVAIGVAGLPAMVDLRGSPDLDGRELLVSITGFADEISAAASLLMGQGSEGLPAVVVRGLQWRGEASGAAALVRPAEGDLFR